MIPTQRPDGPSTERSRPWPVLAWTHTRWVLRTTWRNAEQALLVLGIPVIAYVALSRTDLVSSTIPPLVVTTTIVILAAGFTSPAITLAFERRYGSFAFLATTPLPRSAIVFGTLLAVTITTSLAVLLLMGLAAAIPGPGSAHMTNMFAAVVLGLFSVLPWAFVVGGTARSEAVLAVANAIFVVAVLFGGVLVPVVGGPLGVVIGWLPPSNIVQLAWAPHLSSGLVLVAWGVTGVAIASRVFRWR